MTWEDLVQSVNKYGYKQHIISEELDMDKLKYLSRDSTLIPPTADLIFYEDGMIVDVGGLTVAEGRTYEQMLNILINLYE